MGEMAAGLAHELNQPLTAISSYLGGALRRLRAQEPMPGELIAAVDKAFQQALRAGDILRWLQGFIKKEEAEKAFTDIHEIIDVVIGLIRARFRKRGVSLELCLDRSLPCILVGPIQIQQLFLNLLWNALEAIDEDHPVERVVTIYTAVADSHHVRVTVRNTGPVIEPEKLDRIFDPFFTTKSDGMGLGLSICQSILENHHGRLWAESDEEYGTRFNFTLPLSEKSEYDDE